MSKKVAVFLTGGGARGPFQIGFFQALEELNIKPELICGCSVGALVGGAATYMNSNEMMKCWKTLTLESVLQVDKNKILSLNEKRRKRKLVFETFISCCRPPGLLIDIENIRKLLYSSVDGNKILESNVDFGIATTELPNLKFHRFYKKDMTCNPLEYILSSLYLPIFRPQKIINGKHYLDSASIRTYPFDMVNSEKYSDVIIVNVSTRKDKKIQRDILKANFKPTTNLILINMEEKSSMLDFSEEKAEYNYKMGYKRSMEVLLNSLKK